MVERQMMVGETSPYRELTPISGEQKAHRVRKSLEEEEPID
jgi:hypothetical protein